MVFELIKNLGERHERLKKKIHSFRIPLSPTGQKIMGFVYFCIPLIAGYYIMDAATSQAKINLKDVDLEKEINSSSYKNIKDQNNALQVVLDNARKTSR